MTKPDYQRVVDLLLQRDGEATDVALRSGEQVRVYHIACSYDLGNPVAFISTDVLDHEDADSAHFTAEDVVRIVDPENGAIWFEIQDEGASA